MAGANTDIECQECRRVSDAAWQGWRAYRGDVPNDDPAPLLVFHCPDCAERELGPFPTGSRERASQ